MSDNWKTTDDKPRKDNIGMLFINRKEKENPDDADFYGDIKVNGIDYWCNGRLGHDKRGLIILRLSIKPKETAYNR